MGEAFDKLAIQANLSNYTDIYGQRMPTSVLLETSIPKQFADKAQETTLDSIKVTVQTASASIAVGNAVFTLLLQTSLNQLWSMLNN